MTGAALDLRDKKRTSVAAGRPKSGVRPALSGIILLFTVLANALLCVSCQGVRRTTSTEARGVPDCIEGIGFRGLGDLAPLAGQWRVLGEPPAEAANYRRVSKRLAAKPPHSHENWLENGKGDLLLCYLRSEFECSDPDLYVDRSLVLFPGGDPKAAHKIDVGLTTCNTLEY